MTFSQYVTVHVDLDHVRAAAERVKRAVAGADVIAVLKADAYGLGAARVADAIAPVVDGFYVFELAEATAIDLRRYGKPILSLLDETDDPTPYRDAGVRPVVWTTRRAAALRGARPVLSVDTGQQRFACAREDVDAILSAGAIEEAMTHASNAQQAVLFDQLTAGRGLRRHAAGTALLDDPAARFDAVRPGLALYRDAVRVSTRLVDARDSNGPAGYGGFVTRRHGVILAGYAHGLSVGPCLVNGQPRRILEVGMQTAFVELEASDRAGDEGELLGDALPLETVATAWQVPAQAAMLRLCGLGRHSGPSPGTPGEAR
ncbi:MAG TPA: alanine racemase [Tepidisphaeraceae bacterium]|jgi:alanine racemase|nr:alanine racemase [Tepidisphaeraceae bacterium]